MVEMPVIIKGICWRTRKTSRNASCFGKKQTYIANEFIDDNIVTKQDIKEIGLLGVIKLNVVFTNKEP